MRNIYCCVLSALAITAGGAVLPQAARADTFNLTYEAPGVQTANKAALCANLGGGSCTVGSESFDGRSSGSFTTNFGTGGAITGTYTNVQINGPDQYGGSGGTTNYGVAFASTPYSVTLSSTLSSGINYFGFWLSALDAGNQVEFFRNGVSVYHFTPQDLINALGSCSGSNPYCGNPNPAFGGQNPGELYAFVNFFDTSGTFDQIRFSEDPAVGGYESDNHTVGYVTSSSGTPVPEPASMALLGVGLVGAGLVRRRWAA